MISPSRSSTESRCRWWRRSHATSDEFYDFEARYEIGRTDFITRRAAGRADRAAHDLALSTYRLLGCSAFARVDLMLDAGEGLTVLEANPIPGLTETSLPPQAAEAAGISFDALVGRMLELALERQPA